MTGSDRQAARRAAEQCGLTLIALLVAPVLGDWVGGLFQSSRAFVMGTGTTLAVEIAVVAWALGRAGERWASLGFRSVAVPRAAAEILKIVLALYAALMLVAVVFAGVSLVTGARVFDAIGDEKIAVIKEFMTRPLADLLFVGVLAGLGEEIVFRGMLLTRLETVLGHWLGSQRRAWALAVGLSSFVFMLGHLYWGTFGALQTGAIGVVLAVCAARPVGLWACVGAHALFNSVQFAMARWLVDSL